MGDCSDLGVHDAALKFWLPEAAKAALEELAGRYGESMSELLRQFFAVHCYGLYAVHLMTERSPKLFKDHYILYARRAPDDSAHEGKIRIDTYWVPELGKNVAPIKLWVATRMRGDLQQLAEHVGIKLSQYLREIVISRLLGHGTLPGRPAMFEAMPVPAADDWCEDREVPWREVAEDEYRRNEDRRRDTTWVDP
jgi:hypothetical protein